MSYKSMLSPYNEITKGVGLVDDPDCKGGGVQTLTEADMLHEQ